jgi:hypothetical protein
LYWVSFYENRKNGHNLADYKRTYDQNIFDSFCIAALCVLQCFGVISASEIRVSQLLG